jgi:hypothetical protein
VQGAKERLTKLAQLNTYYTSTNAHPHPCARIHSSQCHCCSCNRCQCPVAAVIVALIPLGICHPSTHPQPPGQCQLAPIHVTNPYLSLLYLLLLHLYSPTCRLGLPGQPHPPYTHPSTQMDLSNCPCCLCIFCCCTCAALPLASFPLDSRISSQRQVW